MKKLVILLLALTIAGCASVKNPITNTRLYQAELVFDGGVKSFNELKGLCVRRVLPPVCRTYVVAGQNLIVKANAADKAAQNFVDKNPTLDATNAISAFTGIVSDFEVNLSNLSSTKGQ